MRFPDILLVIDEILRSLTMKQDPHNDLTSIHVQRAITGDLSSTEWLIHRLTPLLLMQAETRMSPSLRRQVEPSDVVEDVWAISLPRLSELRPSGGGHARVLVKYLSTVLLHRVLDLAKRSIRRQLSGELGGEPPRPLSQLADQAAGIVTAVARRERGEAVWQVLSALNEEDRKVIVYRGIEQRTLDEVAVLMDLKPGTVAVRYHRAMKRLEKELPAWIAEEFLASPDAE